MRKVIECLEKLIGKVNVKQNINLKNYLTFKVQCVAKILIEIYNRNDLIKVLNFLNSVNEKYVILGGGSNTLFKKSVVKEIVIHLCNGYERIYFKNGKYYLSVFAGNRVANVIKKCKNANFSCIEWAIGIPATIGGAVTMNMGAFNSEIKDCIESVTIYCNGAIKKLSADECAFNYRDSLFKKENYVIISAVLKLEKKTRKEIDKNLSKYLKIKSSLQPLSFPSLGSIFKNGSDYKSAKLIEMCGLKGYIVGGAKVSVKHSNFIINYNSATALDVLELIKIIKNKVLEKFNINLQEEIIVY